MKKFFIAYTSGSGRNLAHVQEFSTRADAEAKIRRLAELGANPKDFHVVGSGRESAKEEA